MDLIEILSADKLALSFLTLFLVRHSMIVMLPDAVAGPGGWFIDTQNGG